MYGWGCKNLMSGDGLRWFVSDFMDNIRHSPWDYILMLSISISILKESEIFNFRNKKIYLKQKKAYFLVGLLIAIIAALIIICYFLPGNVLLNAFGSFKNSPLQHGLFPIIAIIIIILSLVYGYASGRFTGLDEIIRALVVLLMNISAYFVTFIIASQLYAIVLYSFFNTDMTGGSNSSVYCLLIAGCLFYIPWLLHVIYAYRKS